MENRRIRRPFWFTLGAGVILWIVLGFILDPDKIPVNDLFDIFSVATFFMAFLFVATYTIAGMIGTGKWWQNEVGTYLVLSFTSIMFIVGPVAFAVMFNDGQINTWWWAWVWLGGHVMAAFMIGALSILWIRNFIVERRQRNTA